ncbi:M15 family metallopeptidase [Salinicoccus albus]|uniref:M15 family metallopeptidase n=1 Tax=Salinicoccus albus TaxID=418756 RepID=UPI00037D4A46|nr:M15 family metallopeptidase [Salinicoccus albus]
MNQLRKFSAAFLGLAVFTALIFTGSHTAAANDYSQDALEEKGLQPYVAKQAAELVQRAADKGIVVRITDDYRSFSEQDELYAQGRTDPGLIVTNAEGGESYHNYGLAVDYALELDNGQVIWDTEYDGNGNSKSDWFEVAQIGKNLGFTWGGDWKYFKDYPHLQMDFGHSLDDLQSAN